MAGGMTDAGRRRLGEFITQTRIKAGHSSQSRFAAWLTETTKDEDGVPEIEVKESAVSSLEAGRYRNMLSPDTLMVIIDTKILKHKDGRAYTWDDAIAVLRGQFCPFEDHFVEDEAEV